MTRPCVEKHPRQSEVPSVVCPQIGQRIVDGSAITRRRALLNGSEQTDLKLLRHYVAVKNELAVGPAPYVHHFVDFGIGLRWPGGLLRVLVV
jgi:hypothetical protein